MLYKSYKETFLQKMMKTILSLKEIYPYLTYQKCCSLLIGHQHGVCLGNHVNLHGSLLIDHQHDLYPCRKSCEFTCFLAERPPAWPIPRKSCKLTWFLAHRPPAWLLPRNVLRYTWFPTTDRSQSQTWPLVRIFSRQA